MAEELKLSAKEIDWLDEMNNDEQANDATLDRAMNRHSNVGSRLRMARDKFWKEMASQMDIDLPNMAGDGYKLRVIHQHGAMYITKVPIKELENDNG